MEGWYEKVPFFRPTFRFILEMIQDTAYSYNGRRMQCNLSNAAVSNDLE